MTATVVKQNPAHQLGRNSKKLVAVLPLDSSLLNQAKIDLVNQRRSLKGVVAAFLLQVVSGKAPQFRVKGGGALCEGAVPVAIRIRESCRIFKHLVHDLAASRPQTSECRLKSPRALSRFSEYISPPRTNRITNAASNIQLSKFIIMSNLWAITRKQETASWAHIQENSRRDEPFRGGFARYA